MRPLGPGRYIGRHSGLAPLVAAPILLTACAVIGPTVPMTPSPGKMAEAFESDHRTCMAITDRRLQPVADELDGPKADLRQVAANNELIQEAYNRSYIDCMAARGNVPPSAAVPIAQAQYTPGVVETLMALTSYGNLRDGWRLLDLSYHAASGHDVDANDALWQREIANPPGGPGGAVPVFSISFADGARTILLSIVQQGAEVCDNGPNTASSKRDYAICPGKIGVVENGRLLAILPAGRLCVEALNTGGVVPGAPDWKSPTRWGTRARYDPAARTIEVLTLQDSDSKPDCDKMIRVP